MTTAIKGWLPDGPYKDTGPGFRTEFTAREELGYEYSEFMVLTDEDGRVFVAISEGCSCSKPWAPEDISLDDLTAVHDLAELGRKFRAWNYEPRGYGKDYPDPVPTTILTEGQFTEAMSRLAELRLFS